MLPKSRAVSAVAGAAAVFVLMLVLPHGADDVTATIRQPAALIPRPDSTAAKPQSSAVATVTEIATAAPVVSEKQPQASATLVDKAHAIGFSNYFHSLLLEELGPRILAAVHRRGMFETAVKEVDYLWSIKFTRGLDPITAPIEGLQTPGHQLVFMKRSTSVAIGRMYRDASLKELFEAIETERSLTLYRSAVRRFVNGLARNVITLLQGVVDTLPAQQRAALNELGKKRVLGAPDPTHVLMSMIDVNTTPEKVNEWLADIPASLDVSTRGAIHRTERVMRMAYVNMDFNDQQPKKQKFFSMFRPTIGCHSIQRECENPDGCRFICNLEYLQNQLQDGTPFANRFIGVGSNNEYDYELSLRNMFDERTSKNGIHSITSFDCTLQGGFKPPQELVTDPIGWAGADICIGEKTSGKYMSFLDMKQAILSSEKANSETLVRPDVDGKRTITRHAMKSMAAGEPGFAFDAVSIFKTDIEGFEFAMLPSWSRADLDALRSKERVLKKLATPDAMIDFSKEVDFFTVSQFLLEYHASGHDYMHMWHMAHTLFQLTQMGFAMAVSEKNYYGDCCAEAVYVHYRYFIRSEMWAGGEFPAAPNAAVAAK